MLKRNTFISQILTGDIPFPGYSPIAATIAVFNGDLPRRPSHHECSDDLWRIVQRCWEKDPENRIDANGVIDALDD